jgi:predicted transcriptional regulator
MEACSVKAKIEDRFECERRDRQDIIMGILRTAELGSKKTRIISKVRLSSAQATKYLGNLKEAGFISEESGTWKTTKEGLRVIDACRICHNLINKDGAPVSPSKAFSR